MFDTQKTKLPSAMGFYHQNGFVPAFKQASKYASKKGHVGTMLDWVDARLSSGPYKKFGYYDPSNPTPWDMYYTTMSAEYVGYGKMGRKILIVAHGIGPMATLDGCLAAYRWEYESNRSRQGGRITAEEFLKLESGAYGEVEIVDMEAYLRTRQYPFMQKLRMSQALKDQVLMARLGPKAVEYITCHATHAMRYHKEEGKRRVTDPYILEVGGPSCYWSEHYKIEEGLAYAHLLSTGGVMLSHHDGDYAGASWMSDVHAHDWSDGTRLIGVREGSITGISKGPDPYRLLRTNWEQLMEPSGIKVPFPGDFHVLMQLADETWFTQIDKKGDCLDTNEPEFRVTRIEPVGGPVQFFTDVLGYYGFFKYSKAAVRAIMPPGANAYAYTGEPTIVPGSGHEKQTCMMQPYRVEIDHTKRLIREKTLANNYERMMELMAAA